jgi:hypothetical protein
VPTRPRFASVFLKSLTALVGAAMVLAGCGGPGSSSLPSATPSASRAEATATPDLSKPAGVIAIGHSGLTGEGTGEPGQAAKENSWATGTNPNVNSVYLRLAAVRPETKDHVANTAHGGARSGTLVGQATSALQQVPVPALAIIQSIDSDIRCDGTDAENVKPFGENIRAGLETITKASPNAQILIVGQLGRPSAVFISELVAREPSQKDALTGTGPCDFFNEDGKLVLANIQTLTTIIDSYEKEQARVCAQFPTCHTDGGVRARYIDKIENFSADFNHLNIAGQADEAALIWPVVKEILQL